MVQIELLWFSGQHYLRSAHIITDNIRNEGDQVEVRHFNTNGTEFVIKHFHWNKSTYEMALFRAGLSTVEFHRAQIAPVAAKADNEKYWDDFLAYNEIMFIKATKADS